MIFCFECYTDQWAYQYYSTELLPTQSSDATFMLRLHGFSIAYILSNLNSYVILLYFFFCHVA